MLESNSPEVNIDELIKIIREDAIKRQNSLPLVSSNSNIQSSVMNLSISHIESLIRTAELRSCIRTKWPDKLNQFPFSLTKGLQKLVLKTLNFIFKDQREVNFNLINALKESVTLNRQLILETVTLNSRLENLQLQLDKNYTVVDRDNDKTDEKLADVRTLINETNNQTQTIKEYLESTDSRVQKIENLYTKLNKNTIKNDNYIKKDLVQQKRLITLLLEEAKQRLTEPFNLEKLKTLVSEEGHLLDEFYAAFEDRFRGSRAEIHDRLKVYLPFIKKAGIGTFYSPILDVGCGRGEWLELLQESGYIARGLDVNRAMLEQCQVRGIDVLEADMVEYLQSLPDSSLGAVTGFHIIEHLPFEKQIKLLDESIRVLTPNGLVIFETPNPRNILVGSGDFYRDPTHEKPLHPDTLKFLAEARGLINSEIYFFEEKDETLHLSDSATTKFNELNDYINISRDMVLIAYKS